MASMQNTNQYCSCGRRMHASDAECERCWRDREYPES